MNNELDVAPAAEIVLPRPMPDAVDALMRHAEVMSTAYDLASKLVRTALVPAIYRGKADDATAAILYGAELGLTPIQSLQQIFAVHGQPAIYARTMVALLKRRGYLIGTVESSDESVTVHGSSPGGETEMSTWTIDRARKAGYVPVIDEKTGEYKKNDNGKLAGNMKYLTDPQAMLYAKAAAEVCRRLAPDVLLGIAYTREDLESEPARVESHRQTRQAQVTAADILGLANGAVPVDVDDPPKAEPASESLSAPAEESSDQTDPKSEDDTETGDEEPAASEQQIRTLGELLRSTGHNTRKKQLDWINKHFESGTVEGPNQLTATEISLLIRELEEAAAAAETTDDGEQPEPTGDGQ